MPDHMDEGYTRLATAIIKQARSDYQSTGKRLMRNMYKRSETKMADYRVFDSCLRFFQRSCNGFVDADGADILKKPK